MKNNMFGFGCMRLPVLDSKDNTTFDYELIEKMFDYYLDQGYTYFDTAYTYHSYEGEKAVKKALVDRYPRQAFELTTKLPLRDFKDEADMQKIFDEQLMNTGVSYFDYYLLHNMGHNVYQKCIDNHAFEFVVEMKKKGKIKHVGMSFHDTPELLDEILGKYGDCLDFIQLQVNYLDWNHPVIKARECVDVAVKYGKPVTVMEPCKGGTLVNLPDEAIKLLKEYNPDRSIASWAFRFVLSQQGISRVLSGMNSMQQVEDNLNTVDNFEPLNKEEYALLEEVTKIINKTLAIDCTGCGYCREKCPQNICIPQAFSLYNQYVKNTGGSSSQRVYYRNLILAGYGKASDCLKCGLCEKACPQHLPIREKLEMIAPIMESSSSPTRKA